MNQLANDPVSHLLVVGRYLDENGLNADVRVFSGQVCQEIELLLDLINGLFLVGDDFESRREFALADERHHFHSGLLLAFVDNVSILAFGLLKTVTRNRNVVDRERDRLRDPCGQRTVLKTGQRVSSHVEIHILSLKVTETVKLLPNHFSIYSPRLSGESAWNLLP